MRRPGREIKLLAEVDQIGTTLRQVSQVGSVLRSIMRKRAHAGSYVHTMIENARRRVVHSCSLDSLPADSWEAKAPRRCSTASR